MTRYKAEFTGITVKFTVLPNSKTLHTCLKTILLNIRLTLYPPISGLSFCLVKKETAPPTGIKRNRKLIQKTGRISDPYLPARNTLSSAGHKPYKHFLCSN